MLFNKPLDELEEADLQSLIDDQIAEKQIVDYKKGLNLDSEEPRAEFRRDVTSFANALGGHLVFGMKETDGFPTELCGMDIPNFEAFRLRIDAILQTKVTPRVPGYRVHCLRLANGKAATVISIPKSFAKPHQVTVDKDDFQFWARNSAGKYRLSVDELRTVILQSETLTERIRNFRLERLSNQIADDTPIPMWDTARVVLHLIPLSAFDSPSAVDLQQVPKLDRELTSPIVEGDGFRYTEYRYNLDGILVHIGVEDKSMTYLQVFRTGMLEYVEAYFINKSHSVHGKVWGPDKEQFVHSAINRALKLLAALGVAPPIVVMLSLVNVAGLKMDPKIGHAQTGRVAQPLRQNVLALPEQLIDSLNVEPDTILKPILDILWNAGGFARCLTYNAEGERVWV